MSRNRIVQVVVQVGANGEICKGEREGRGGKGREKEGEGERGRGGEGEREGEEERRWEAVIFVEVTRKGSRRAPPLYSKVPMLNVVQP